MSIISERTLLVYPGWLYDKQLFRTKSSGGQKGTYITFTLEYLFPLMHLLGLSRDIR